MYQPIRSIAEIAPESVMDFTTISENHSFVANGFVVGNCGLLENMAVGCHIRAGHDPKFVIDVVERTPGFVPIHHTDRKQRQSFTVVLVNGILVGYVEDSDTFAFRLREMRRLQSIPFDTAIVYKPGLRSLQLHTDSGCCCSPVFNLSNMHLFDRIFKSFAGQSQLLIQELMLAGVIEYVSKEEESTIRVAVDLEDLLNPQDNSSDDPYTHLEIHSSLLAGACLSLIPCPNHNQTPRNIYECAMQKQSQSIVGLNPEYRVDTMSMGLCYPQVPLVQTCMEKTIGATDLAMGQNAMVAVANWNNEEDSISMNQSSIDRGLFRSYFFRSYKDEERVRGTDSTKFERPPKKRRANYDKLSDEGYVLPGTIVDPNDILIGKTMITEEVHDPDDAKPVNQTNQRGSRTIKRDNSTMLRTNESAVVHKIIETKNREGAKALKLTTLAYRKPEIGDKFARYLVETRKKKKRTNSFDSLLIFFFTPHSFFFFDTVDMDRKEPSGWSIARKICLSLEMDYVQTLSSTLTHSHLV
jgi:DNA-directed RNA polymerase II subunit RPB2